MLHLTIRTNQFELGSEQDNVSRKEEGIFFFFFSPGITRLLHKI